MHRAGNQAAVMEDAASSHKCMSPQANSHFPIRGRKKQIEIQRGQRQGQSGNRRS